MKKREEKQLAKQQKVQAKNPDGIVSKGDMSPAKVMDTLGEGQAMGVEASRMGQAMGANFSDVRIHTDDTAVQLNRDLGSSAFAVGNHIAFGQGQYKPGTMVGDALLAHELAHVQQQGASHAINEKNHDAAYEGMEQEADNVALGAVSSLWGKSKEFASHLGGKSKAGMRTGLRLQLGDCPGPSQAEIDKRTKEKVAELEKQQPKKSGDTGISGMPTGKQYTVVAGDTWDSVARDHGISEDDLKAFNKSIITGTANCSGDYACLQLPALTPGSNIYIPSGREVVFMDFLAKYGTLQAAAAAYNTWSADPAAKIYDTARERASGTVGEGYGTGSSTFYTQNPDIVGATLDQSVSAGSGGKEYKVTYAGGQWKCNIYMNDTVYSSGYTPNVSEHKKYMTAGTVDTYDKQNYKKKKIADTQPGDIIQYDGGSGGNDSHNMILTSFITVTPDPATPGQAEISFQALGAEDNEAAESSRSYTIKTDESGDYYELVGHSKWKHIRFFYPGKKR